MNNITVKNEFIVLHCLHSILQQIIVENFPSRYANVLWYKNSSTIKWYRKKMATKAPAKTESDPKIRSQQYFNVQIHLKSDFIIEKVCNLSIV